MNIEVNETHVARLKAHITFSDLASIVFKAIAERSGISESEIAKGKLTFRAEADGTCCGASYVAEIPLDMPPSVGPKPLECFAAAPIGRLMPGDPRF